MTQQILGFGLVWWAVGGVEGASDLWDAVYFSGVDAGAVPLHPGHHWVTALGLVTDAALQCMLIEGARGRSSNWMLRWAIRLFDQLTAHVDLSGYRTGAPQLEDASEDERSRLFRDLYQQLEDHGFDLVPYERALEVVAPLRRRSAAALEFQIDELLAPRGFWGHAVGHQADWYAPQLP